MKSLDAQIRAMRRWQTFKLMHVDSNRVIWLGDLAGIERAYKVSIDYSLPCDQRGRTISFPLVRVLSPMLRPQPNAAEEGPLPHVYFDDLNPLLSSLCLFDTRANEWTHDDLIAETTVPWTADWLTCYECWLATGRWLGGGRHAGTETSK